MWEWQCCLQCEVIRRDNAEIVPKTLEIGRNVTARAADDERDRLQQECGRRGSRKAGQIDRSALRLVKITRQARSGPLECSWGA
jgi:hypothetical protein